MDKYSKMSCALSLRVDVDVTRRMQRAARDVDVLMKKKRGRGERVDRVVMKVLMEAAEDVLELFHLTVHDLEDTVDRQRTLLDRLLKPHVTLDRDAAVEALHSHTQKANDCQPPPEPTNDHQPHPEPSNDGRPHPEPANDNQTCPESTNDCQPLDAVSPDSMDDDDGDDDEDYDPGVEDVGETFEEERSTLRSPELGSSSLELTVSDICRVESHTRRDPVLQQRIRHRSDSEEQPEHSAYKCNKREKTAKCGKSFKQKTHLKFLNEERTFTCRVSGCGKGFAQAGDLKSHESTHEITRPKARRGRPPKSLLPAHSKSKACGEEFATKADVVRRVRTRANKPTNQPTNDSQPPSEPTNGGQPFPDPTNGGQLFPEPTNDSRPCPEEPARDETEALSPDSIMDEDDDDEDYDPDDKDYDPGVEDVTRESEEERPTSGAYKEGSRTNVLRQQRIKQRSDNEEPPEARRSTPHPDYKCKVCGEEFSLKKDILKHAWTHAEESSPSSSLCCGLCGRQTTDTRSLSVHLKSHRGLYLVCPVCGQSCNSPSAQVVHMRVHTGEKPFACAECGKGFKQKGSLRQHMRVHSSDRKFACNVCARTFVQKDALDVHLRSHDRERSFACRVSGCGKSFAAAQLLRRHELTHRGWRPYACAVCREDFRTRPELLHHQRTVHLVNKCKACGEEFRRKADILKHVRTHAKEPSPLLCCGLCGHQTEDARSLWVHLKSHRDLNYMCDVCGKGFPSAVALKGHMTVHTGERPFSCAECGKSFKQWGNVDQHMRTHTGERKFACDLCGKTFALKLNRDVHLKFHNKERTFMCRVRGCGKGFMTPGDLKRHDLIHTGEKPYVCAVCGSRFQARRSLNIHMDNHHSGNDGATGKRRERGKKIYESMNVQ